MTVSALMTHRTVRPVLIVLGYIVIQIALGQIALAYHLIDRVPSWYPEAGVSLALLLLFGLRYLPVVLIGSVITEVLIYHPGALLDDSLELPRFGDAVLGTFSFGLVAWAMQRWLKFDVRLCRVRDVAMLAGAAMTAPLGIALSSLAMEATGFLKSDVHYFPGLFQWWMANVVGILTITPFLLLSAHVWQQAQVRQERGKPRFDLLLTAAEILILSLIVLLVLWLSFVWQPTRDYHILYFCFVPLIWITLRQGLSGAVAANVALNTAIALGIWYFGNALENLIDVQIFSLILSLTGLFLGAVVSERIRVEESERKQLRLSHTLQEVGGLLTSEMSLSQVLDRIFDLLAQVIEYYAVSVHLLGEDRHFHLTLARGYKHPDLIARFVDAMEPDTYITRWTDRDIIINSRTDPAWVSVPGLTKSTRGLARRCGCGGGSSAH